MCNGACVDTQTDSENCGGCGLACGACTGGECVTTLASDQYFPNGIAVDSSGVYWGESLNDSLVLRVGLAGGAITTLVVGSSQAIWSLATNVDSVFWTAGTENAKGVVMAQPKAGGVPVTLISEQNYESSYGGLAVSATDLYWAAGTNPQEAVMAMPLGGGAPLTVASGQSAQQVAIDATSIYWTDIIGTTVMKAGGSGKSAGRSSGKSADSRKGGPA
jgi:hypothetical protein